MIEKIVYDYLTEKLNNIAYMEKPTGISEFVLIEKTGSGKYNKVNSATIAIQSYSDTLYKAAELNEKVKEAMEDIVELDSVSKCSLNSDYNYTDTQTKEHRYQAVFDLVY